MAPEEIQLLVDQGARLERRIGLLDAQSKKLSARLTTIKSQLAKLVPESAPLAVAAQATAGGGRSWNLPAKNGGNVRVTQPAARLLSKISEELGEKLKALCGIGFSKLFVASYNCAPKFRELLYRYLQPEMAVEVLALVEEPSIPTVTITA